MDWQALQARTNNASLAAFGVSVLLNGQSVTADFLEPSDEVSLDGVSAIDRVPQLLLASPLVPTEPVGKACIVAGVAYVVADARPDGLGMVRIFLERNP